MSSILLRASFENQIEEAESKLDVEAWKLAWRRMLLWFPGNAPDKIVVSRAMYEKLEAFYHSEDELIGRQMINQDEGLMFRRIPLEAA